MKASNLEKALAGGKVVDHDGNEVTQLLKQYETVGGNYLVGVCGDTTLHYDMNGEANKILNLFMAPRI
jgi:hypothetical protein